MHATYPIRPFLGFLVFAAALGAASAQTPPPELTLKAKVRDFVDRTMAEATVNPHPHFYGDVPHQVLCNAVAQGVNIAQADIAVDDGIGDTAQFKADNRGPRLVAPLDPRVEHCFEPVARFSDWYNDVPGVNRAFLVDLVFSYNTATRRYEYFKDDYFPLDNGAAYQPLGAYTTFGHQIPGHTGHNFGFTLELHTKFSYFAGKGQTFEFRGDDDIWVFINGKRVIDLGGMHEHQTAVVNLDAVAASLGLTDSLSYPLDFFFAERHVTTSMLRISTDLELEAVLSDPILTPGGFFQGQKEVTITHSSDKVTLYYTTDGTTPDATSQVYTPGTPITLSTTTTLKVIALRPGFHSSQVVSATYTRQDTVATPAATPKGQSFTEPLSVTLSVSTPGAVIRYTLDGTEPKETSPVYSGPIPVTATTTLKARGYLPNWLPSGLLTEVYTDAATLPPPVANPPGGGFTTSRTVSLSVPGHADADIRYTLDGQEPTASSPLYSDPLTFDRTTELKAKAFKADWKASQTLTETYSRLVAGVRGVYVDTDGDGRIETAILKLDMVSAAIPSSVQLVDPTTKSPATFESNHISLGATGDVLVVRFPDRPFTPCTAFPPEPLASFPGVAGHAPQAFTIADSAGPVPIKAVAKNKLTPTDRAWVDITFSEPIDLARLQAGREWPFDILREGAVETRPVQVATIEAVPGPTDAHTYRWTFEATSPAWPVYIDSLTLAKAPLVLDANGVAGVPGGKRIPVDGGPIILSNAIQLQVRNSVTLNPSHVSGDAPDQIRQNPFAIVIAGNGSCLSCAPGTEAYFSMDRPMPELELRTKFPVQYNFVIYDHLGNFVSRTEGRITEAMLSATPLDPDGFRTLLIRWYPTSRQGRAAGTGAYILKGTAFNRTNGTQKGPQGEDQTVTAASAEIFKKFGYLRRH